MPGLVQFRDQVGPLQDAGITTVAFDAFGCGGSPKPRDPAAYAPGELYADLEATYERFGKVRQVLLSSLAVPALLCTTSLSCSYALLSLISEQPFCGGVASAIGLGLAGP